MEVYMPLMNASLPDFLNAYKHVLERREHSRDDKPITKLTPLPSGFGRIRTKAERRAGVPSQSKERP